MNRLPFLEAAAARAGGGKPLWYAASFGKVGHRL